MKVLGLTSASLVVLQIIYRCIFIAMIYYNSLISSTAKILNKTTTAGLARILSL